MHEKMYECGAGESSVSGQESVALHPLCLPPRGTVISILLIHFYISSTFSSTINPPKQPIAQSRIDSYDEILRPPPPPPPTQLQHSSPGQRYQRQNRHPFPLSQGAFRPSPFQSDRYPTITTVKPSEPSFFQKVSGWFFSNNDKKPQPVYGPPSPVAVPSTYGPPQPQSAHGPPTRLQYQRQNSKKNCFPCNYIPWVPVLRYQAMQAQHPPVNQLNHNYLSPPNINANNVFRNGGSPHGTFLPSKLSLPAKEPHESYLPQHSNRIEAGPSSPPTTALGKPFSLSQIDLEDNSPQAGSGPPKPLTNSYGTPISPSAYDSPYPETNDGGLSVIPHDQRQFGDNNEHNMDNNKLHQSQNSGVYASDDNLQHLDTKNVPLISKPNAAASSNRLPSQNVNYTTPSTKEHSTPGGLSIESNDDPYVRTAQRINNLFNQNIGQILQPIPLPNLSPVPIPPIFNARPFRKHNDFTNGVIITPPPHPSHSSQQTHKPSTSSNNRNKQNLTPGVYQLLPSIPVAEFTSSVEYPISIVQSPLLDIDTGHEQNHKEDHKEESSQDSYNFNTNPIVVENDNKKQIIDSYSAASGGGNDHDSEISSIFHQELGNNEDYEHGSFLHHEQGNNPSSEHSSISHHKHGNNPEPEGSTSLHSNHEQVNNPISQYDTILHNNNVNKHESEQSTPHHQQNHVSEHNNLLHHDNVNTFSTTKSSNKVSAQFLPTPSTFQVNSKDNTKSRPPSISYSFIDQTFYNEDYPSSSTEPSMYKPIYERFEGTPDPNPFKPADPLVLQSLDSPLLYLKPNTPHKNSEIFKKDLYDSIPRQNENNNAKPSGLLSSTIYPQSSTVTPWSNNAFRYVDNNRIVPGRWPPPLTDYKGQGNTTKKPKRIQIIIPYTSQNEPSPFKFSSNNIASSSGWVPMIDEIATNSARKVPSSEVNQKVLNGLHSSNSIIDYHESSESKIISSSTPSFDTPTGNFETKTYPATPPDLLTTYTPGRPSSETTFDIKKLQKNIDDWTAQEYSKIYKRQQKASTISHLKRSKKIPDEYLTTTPSQQQRKSSKAFLSTINDLNASFLDNEAAGSIQHSVESELTDEKLIENLNNQLYDESTNIPFTAQSTYYTSTSLPTTTPYVELSTGPTKLSWDKIQTSISPLTKEKVYVVTPQPSTNENSRWNVINNTASNPIIEKEPSSGLAFKSPRFLVRPTPGPTGSQKDHSAAAREKLSNIPISGFDWLRSINHLEETTTTESASNSLFGLSAVTAYTPPIGGTAVQTITGHSKVITVVTPSSNTL